MSQENVEIVRRFFEGWNAGNMDWVLCVYQNPTAAKGMIEKEWIHAQFFALTDPQGQVGNTKFSGKIGELVLFRTSVFKEGEPNTTLSEKAALSAAGSWAVTAPCAEGKRFNEEKRNAYRSRSSVLSV